MLQESATYEVHRVLGLHERSCLRLRVTILQHVTEPKAAAGKYGAASSCIQFMALETIREALHYAQLGGRLSLPLFGLNWVEEATKRRARSPHRAHTV